LEKGRAAALRLHNAGQPAALAQLLEREFQIQLPWPGKSSDISSTNPIASTR
jgi:hypothetical protein